MGDRSQVSTSGAVLFAAIASGALVATHVISKATRDTLFLGHFGLELLPAAMIGAALLSSFAAILVSRVLSLYGPARVVSGAFAIAAVLFLFEWWLSLHDERAATIVVYAHTAVFGSAAVSAFWSLVNERFDPHAAKKLVGRIASGGTIGGVVGGLVAWRASAHLSVPTMLAVLSSVNVVGLGASLRIGAPEKSKTAAPMMQGGGMTVLRQTPYLRDLAYLVLAGAIMQALLDWLLSARATHVYGKGPQLLGFFALFNTAVGVLSFLAQTSLTRPVLEKRGLGGTIKVQPAGIAVCAIAAILVPDFAAILVLRGVEAVTRSSLYRSAYELFYTPLPAAKKRLTKTFIDVGVDRVGTAIGSIALLAIAQLAPGAATRVVLFVTLAMAAAAWLIATRLQDGYVQALASSLKSGAVALSEEESIDFTTRKTLAETTALLDRDKLLARIEQFQRDKAEKGEPLSDIPPRSVREPAPLSHRQLADPDDAVVGRIETFRSGDVARIRSALGTALTLPLVPFVVPLLGNDAIVRDVVRALRKIAPKATGVLVDMLLDPDVDAMVRRRIPRVLKACRTKRAAEGLLLALRDPIFEVRVQVALALSQLRDESKITIDRDAVLEATLFELSEGRTSWAPSRSSEGDSDGTSRGLSHVFTVLGLVLEREPLSIAFRASRSDDRALRGTAFEYLDVVLPPHVRDVLVPLLGDVRASSIERRAERGSARELAEQLIRSQAAIPRSR